MRIINRFSHIHERPTVQAYPVFLQSIEVHINKLYEHLDHMTDSLFRLSYFM